MQYRKGKIKSPVPFRNNVVGEQSMRKWQNRSHIGFLNEPEVTIAWGNAAINPIWFIFVKNS